jgi:uncharacterized protein YebE (UPF0316 family)
MINHVASLFGPEVWRWVVMPLVIVVLRVCDVSLDTTRIIFINRGYQVLASLIGFFQVLVWLFVITQIVTHLTEFHYYIAYAFGFAAGNYLGIALEQRLGLGLQVVRVITAGDATGLLQRLEKENFGHTNLDAQGHDGQVRLILSVIKRKDIDRLFAIVKELAPDAFVTVEDVRSVHEGIFPSAKLGAGRLLGRLRPG